MLKGRLLAVAGAASFFFLVASSAVAAAAPSAQVAAVPDCVVRKYGGAVSDCTGDGAFSVPGSPSARGAHRSRAQPAPRDPTKVYMPVPEVTTGASGETCLRWTDRVLDQPGVVGGTRALVDMASGVLADRYPVCPGQSAQDVSPVVYAIRFWREIRLPDPEPAIAPGWAITGMPSYLETRGFRQRTYTSDTPFGPLELVATGRYYVDWGDGTTTGPHDAEGEPWPDGQIKHTYIDVGRYDVVVTERWSATWRIGDANGTLSGLQTVGRIDDFRVEQVQAVVGVDRG
jgi:hypothetical protein